MQMPPADPDTLFDDLLQDLPSETIAMAREFKAFVRARKVKTPQQLLRVVFLYCGLDKSLRETAADFTLLYESITDSSIAERLAACRPWVQAVLAQMLQTNAVATLPAPWRFLVIDGSHVQGPGAQGTQYRLHICMDLVQLQFVAITVTDQHTGESLGHFPLGPGDIALADRGYAYATPIVETVKKQAEVIVRMSPAHLPVYGSDGQRIEIMPVLRKQPWETHHTIDVCVQAPAKLGEVRGYIHAYRLSEEQANVARQRIRVQSRKKGRTPKDTTLFWAGWVLVFTTVAPALLCAQTISALYRVRWQIEIAIKRWKSVLDVGQLRAKEGSPLAEVWLLGKLLYAVVVERRARRRLGAEWSRLDGERRGTFWRVWKLSQDEVSVHILGVAAWREEGWDACVKVIMERPRRRKLQCLPNDVIDVYHSLPSRDQEALREAA
jgi:Transposase DDE domain